MRFNKKTITSYRKKNSTRNRKANKYLKKGGDRNISVYNDNRISTQQNNDPSFKESGVIHFSDSQAINALREVGTGFSNFFGAKGFDNTIYDNLRNESLTKVGALLQPGEKICNLRMEFDQTTPGLIFHHVYGTLLRSSGNSKGTMPMSARMQMPPSSGIQRKITG